MANYEKLNLVNGTPFAAEHVAHMENGIAAVEAQATAVAGDVATVAGNVEALGKEVEELKKNPGTGGGEGGGASLPEAGPYQYLVTDGEGQWGTADRLAYATTERVVIMENSSLANGPLLNNGTAMAVGDLTVGDTYIVTMDGVSYTTVAREGTQGGETGVEMGAPTMDGPFDEYPFIITFYAGNLYFYDSEMSGYATHSVKIEHVANAVKPIDPAKWLPEGYPYEETTTVFLMNEQAVTLGYDEAGDRVYGSKRVSDPSAVSEGMTVHMTISGDFSYDGDIVLQDEGTFIPIVFEGMDNSMNVSLGNNGFISFYISAVYYDVSIVVSMTSVQQIIQTIDPKFLRPVVNSDTLTKAQAIEYAINLVPIAVVQPSSSYYTRAHTSVAWELDQAADDCCGCGNASVPILSMRGVDESNLGDFELTEDEYNQIATAWGIS